MLLTILSTVGMVLLNILLESVVLVKINLFGIRPDTIIAVIIPLALLKGSGRSMGYAFACGIILDVLFSTFIGLYTLPYVLIAFLAGLFYKKFYADNKLFPFLLAVPAYVIKEFLMGLCLDLSGAEFTLSGSFFRYQVPSWVLTVLLTGLVYALYRKRVDRQEAVKL